MLNINYTILNQDSKNKNIFVPSHKYNSMGALSENYIPFFCENVFDISSGFLQSRKIYKESPSLFAAKVTISVFLKFSFVKVL